MSESSFVMEDNWRQRKSLMLIRKRAYLENCVSPAQMLLRRLFKPPVYSTFNTHACARSRTHTHARKFLCFYSGKFMQKDDGFFEINHGNYGNGHGIIRKMDNLFFETLKSARICEIDIRYLSGFFIFCLSM